MRWFVVAAAWGALLIAAIYMLRAVRAMGHGPLVSEWSGASDPVGLWRQLPFLLLLGALMVLGVWPRLLTDRVDPAAQAIVRAITESRVAPNLAARSTATK
jgi:NADH-quinone oxidoreductase subunit M